MKYVCTVCGYVHDDAVENLPFRKLPSGWVCPICRAPKSLFEDVRNAAAPAAAAAPDDAEPQETLPENG